MTNSKNKITFSDVQLILKEESRFSRTLINQMYDGDWSFGKGAWSLDNSKFYFDNNGAVACIWEVDIKNNTLDKIIPSHLANSPIYLFDKTDAIMYCNENCIYLAQRN